MIRDYGLLHSKLENRARTVEKVRVYFDRTGNTLTVWFDSPRKESICEETGHDVVLIKDEQGRVIGFEQLNYLSPDQQDRGIHVPVEVHMIGV